MHCEACKNRKYHFVILHGYTATGLSNGPARGSSDNWRPWLKEKLEQDGHTIYCPDLPNTNQPNIEEQVAFVLKNTKIDKNTILVGHSLGGVVIYKLLEKANKKVAKVFLVDPVVTPNFPDKSRPMVEKSNNWKFNWAKIKKLSDEFIILGDVNFETIFEKDLKNLAKWLDGNLVLSQPNQGHFTGAEEPMIWQLLKSTDLVPVPEKELPLKLPEVKNYEPTGTGESPLDNIKEWVNTKCPKCGGKASRETNTMPQWAGSSWYYLRYIDPKNKKALVDKAKEKYWSPVDFYVGGAEHATRHLIYARFWHKFLFDIGAVNYDEPFTRLQHVGLILAEDGRKMSKRWNNVVNPDEVVEKYGADAMRVYEMFMGPFSQPCAWSTAGLAGARRFLEKIWKLYHEAEMPACGGHGCKNIPIGLPQMMHKTIKKVTEDIETFHYNTAISQMMIFINFVSKFNSLPRSAMERFLIILSPFAPHLAEELWAELGHKQSIFKEKWPEYDPALVKDEIIRLVVQINGKIRDTVEVDANISEEDAKKVAVESEKIKKWLEGKKVIKVIFVKGRLVNIVVK
ncbi:MAG: alpha/beta fold hydrolase [Patescibacteria group bacterium]|nr:alpha/beta fold hydrolase [Patescibacteria group bacterium]